MLNQPVEGSEKGKAAAEDANKESVTVLPSEAATKATDDNTVSVNENKADGESKGIARGGRRQSKMSGMDIEMQKTGQTEPEDPMVGNEALLATLFHTKEINQAVRLLQSRQTRGLIQQEVDDRLVKFGRNEISLEESVKWYRILCDQLLTPMTAILTIGLILSLVGQEWVEAGVIMFVILTNTAIGFQQEYKAERTMEALRQMASPTAKVLRETTVSYVSAQEVVPGDIILFEEGDIIPADGRIIESFHLEVDESLLTGESVPVAKHLDVIPRPDEPIGDRINLVYATTIVTKGRGKAVVHRTGFGTEMGRIAIEISKAAQITINGRALSKTNLEKTLDYLAYFLLILVAFLAFIVFAVNKFQWSKEVAGYALSIVIAVLPEGLTAVVTITMAFAVRKMAKENAIVRKRTALENLGAVTDICSDKTGTLTQGKMVLVRAFIPNDHYYAVEGVGFKPAGKVCKVNALDDGFEAGEQISGETIPKTLFHFTICASLCNMSVIKRKGVTNEAEREHAIRPNVPLSRFATKTTDVSPADGNQEKGGNDDDDKEEAEAQKSPADGPKEWHQLAQEELAKTEPSDWEAIGDPTEAALQAFGWKLHLGKPHLASAHTSAAPHEMVLLQEFAFDATIKRMSVIYKQVMFGPEAEGVNYWVFAKGAFESIFPLCTGVIMSDGSVDGKKFSTTSGEEKEKLRKECLETIDKFAGRGLRVLSLACRKIPRDPPVDEKKLEKWSRDETEQDLIFLGLAGIYDPPREESKSAVAKCKHAGIKVHMLTGDHPKTAFSIAKEIDIIPKEIDESHPHFSSFMMVATEFDNMKDDELDRLVKLPIVIARCSPVTKVKMVDCLLRRKRIVAMTGDGTNDAPSLKKAQVGIAMGLNGSDVAKQASDIVLTDDNFATIVRAVSEGRRIFINIQKFILHLMSGNVAEIIALIFGLAFVDLNGSTVYPMSPVQILFLNMITSSPPAMGLGLEGSAVDIMDEPPRDTSKPARSMFTNEVIIDILSFGSIMGILSLATWSIVLYNPAAMAATNNTPLGVNCNSANNDGTIPNGCLYVFQARTTSFMTLTSLLLMHAMNCRHLQKSIIYGSEFAGPRNWYSNKFLFWSIIFGYIITIVTIYTPGLNTQAFKQAPISWEWGLIVGSMVIFLIYSELYKLVKRTYFPHKVVVNNVQLADEGGSKSTLDTKPSDVPDVLTVAAADLSN